MAQQEVHSGEGLYVSRTIQAQVITLRVAFIIKVVRLWKYADRQVGQHGQQCANTAYT